MIMAHDLFIERAFVSGAILVLMAGAATAWISANIAKRLVGLALALIGAVMALAGLGAPSEVSSAGVAVGFGQIALGIALLVRLQEAYGATEAPEIDAADGESEPPEIRP